MNDRLRALELTNVALQSSNTQLRLQMARQSVTMESIPKSLQISNTALKATLEQIAKSLQASNATVNSRLDSLSQNNVILNQRLKNLRPVAESGGTGLVSWFALALAIAAIVLWSRSKNRSRTIQSDGRQTPAVSPLEYNRVTADMHAIQSRMLQLENAAKPKHPDCSNDQIASRLAQIEETLNHQKQRLTDQFAASIQVVTPVKPSTEPPLRRVDSESKLLEVIGEIYTTFCRERHEHLLAAFTQALQTGLEKAEVQQIFRAGGAQDLYFTDQPEANPQCYWRVSLGVTHYLLPRPANKIKFEGLQGFKINASRIPAPQTLRLCRPATLSYGQHRWEVTEHGELA